MRLSATFLLFLCAAACLLCIANGASELELVEQRKLHKLISGVKKEERLEGSGVVFNGDRFVVVCDNFSDHMIDAAETIPENSPLNFYVYLKSNITLEMSDGYEAIAYSPELKRYYAVDESVVNPVTGEFNSLIVEMNELFQVERVAFVEFSLPSDNKGFEGAAAVVKNGQVYLLLLCEGNNCQAGKDGEEEGNGRIKVTYFDEVFHKWVVGTTIVLPSDKAGFTDYAVVGNSIMVVSQEDSKLWVGTINTDLWIIEGEGKRYNFPRKNGDKQYCNVEGIGITSTPGMIVAVTDKMKEDQDKDCEEYDQSISLWTIPT